MTVECPKCHGAKWSATGEFSESRRGLRRAWLRCAACGYAFTSGLPDAVDAGGAIARIPGQPLPPARQPSLPGASVRQSKDFTNVGKLANDFKRRAAGDHEDVA